MKKRSVYRVLISILLVCGFAALCWLFKPGLADVGQEIILSKTYHDILADGIQPGLSPDYSFPTSYQYLNGCFGFAVGHILQDRGQTIDMLDMESRIQKPREVLWKKEYKERLAQEYDLEFKWSKNAELLFDLLKNGEAVVIGYQYPLEEGGSILHAVAAYSFDEKGMWISETLSGKIKHLPYEKVFTEKGDQTQYYFTRVIGK